MKKKLVLLAVLIISAVALFIINMFWGNPVSRMNVQKETIKYYENAYKEKFVVYNSEYNPLIPAYIFELGPVSNKNIKFNTGLYSQGITDEYGGILAAAKLSQDVGTIIKSEYGYLNYTINASEEPLAQYAGESPDYFDTNPGSRVRRNHYNLVITVPDGTVSADKLTELSQGLVNTIETKLPYQTPNLKVYIKLKSEQLAGESGSKGEGRKFFELFSTVKYKS